jgi:hypothetical protein
MDLTQWMAANGENDQSVADKVGLTRSYVHRVRHGQVHPSLGVGLSLHNATRGEVPLEMLLPRALRPKVKPLRASKTEKPDSVRKRSAQKASAPPAAA